MRLVQAFAVIAVVSLFGGRAVGVETEKQAAGVAAAKAWLALVDEGKFAESWKEAASLFKGAVTAEQWVPMVESVRKPLGKLGTRKVKTTTYKTSVPGAPDGEYLIIEFETSFANKAAAIETVTPMLDKDGKWRVSGYFIK
jgi:hypothetical protein